MADNRSHGMFAVVLALVVALGAVVFVTTGGELGGKTTVESDRDLPPVATGQVK